MKILGEISAIETIAQGSGIRELALLRQRYGLGNWYKRKGIAVVLLRLRYYDCHSLKGLAVISFKKIRSCHAND